VLIFSDSFYIKDNGNGYALDTRDAICSKCYQIIDRQVKYRDYNKEFQFSVTEKGQWKHCPYCGERLVDKNK
jgi:DNA-directed RNA polymerase subunit RPC12/RpoP